MTVGLTGRRGGAYCGTMMRRNSTNSPDIAHPQASFAAPCWLTLSSLLLAMGSGCGSHEADAKLDPVGLAKHIEAVLSDPTSLPGFATASAPDPASIPDMPVAPVQEADAEGDASSAPDIVDAAAPDPPPQPPVAAIEAPKPVRKVQRSEPIKTRPVAKTKRRAPAPEKVRPVLADEPPAANIAGMDATDLYHRGVQELKSGRAAAAVASLSASQRMRASRRTLVKLGHAYFDAGRLKDAEKTLQAAGRHPEAMLLLAVLYQQTSRVDSTRKTYTAFLTHHPNHPRAAWVRNILKRL